MIADEVICGFGRLGTAFGCETLGFKPHSISIAKALSSAYLPIAGVMIPEAMYQAMLAESSKIGTFGHGFTYSAAIRCRPRWRSRRSRSTRATASSKPQPRARRSSRRGWRRSVDHPLVGEARGLGLIGGVELVADKRDKRALRSHSTASAPRRCNSPKPKA